MAGALRKLETEQPGRRATQLQVYRLKQVTPDAVQSLITALLPDVSLTTDARTQSVIAIGTLTEQQSIATLLEQLEPGTPGSEAKELKTYSTAGLSVETATALFASLTPQAQITHDTKNRRFIIIATESDQQRIDGLLKQMIPAPASQPELKMYPIAAENTDSVTGLLATLAPDAQITHDAPNDRLVVLAVGEDHSRIADILSRLTSTDDGNQIIRSFPAKGLDVSSVTSLLQTLVPKASVTVDTSHERLLIVASLNDLATVENVLKQVVIEDADGEPTLKSYAIAPQVTLTSLTTLLTSLVPEAKITSDEPKRRLLIVASTRDHQVVQAAIEQVETDTGGELPELKFYPLTKSDGENAVSVLRTMAPDSLITYEKAAQRLSVVATRADHTAIAATLTKLEAAAPESEKRMLKIYEVTVTQQSRFARLLNSLQTELPGMQLITDAEPDELTVWATPSQQETVEQILAQLEREIPPGQKRQLIVYPITKADPTGVSEVLNTLFPNTQITVDDKASRLMIHARPAEHATIRSAIEQLDSDIPVEKEIKLMAYPVEGLNATVALNLIQEELPELTVIQDTTAETLIVRTTLRQHQRVAELLDALRSTSTSGKPRSLVVYPLVFPSGSLATTFMTSAFPDARLFPDEENRRMTVW
ncbi:MAG: secretin N-terminal domain-containing protein, partial [Planctomycetaceae bacterium]